MKECMHCVCHRQAYISVFSRLTADGYALVTAAVTTQCDDVGWRKAGYVRHAEQSHVDE